MARYSNAIRWITDNDDTDWLDRKDPSKWISVSAALVADLFCKSDEQVASDLRAAREREKQRRAKGEQA